MPNEEVFPREFCENENEVSIYSNDVCFVNESLQIAKFIF